MDVEKLRLSHDSAEDVEEAQHGIRRKDARSRRLPSLLLAVICGSMAAGASEPTTAQRGYDKDLLSQGVRFIAPAGWGRSVNQRLGGVDFFPPDQGGIMSVGVRKATQEAFERDVLTIQEQTESVTIGGIPGFVWLTEGLGGEVKRKTFMGFKAGKMYLVVLSAGKRKFERYLPTFEQALITLAPAE